VQRRWLSHGEITVCPIVSKRQFTASLISSREKDLRGGTIPGVDDLSDTSSLLLTKEKAFVPCSLIKASPAFDVVSVFFSCYFIIS
jgi:hypothetical protein